MSSAHERHAFSGVLMHSERGGGVLGIIRENLNAFTFFLRATVLIYVIKFLVVITNIFDLC